jgi:hypothetical protein
VFCVEFDWLVDHELVLVERRASDFASSVQSHDEDVDDQGVELVDEGRELQALVVGVVHVFEVYHHVLLSRHIV